MTSHTLINLLKQKHADDVFVSELKSGASTTGRHFRLDGWAMQKSWVKPRVIGYEVKVSRSDFKGDDKWQQYLDVCNELYFVTPHGLVQPFEVPGDVGLIQMYKNGGGLRTIKKAMYRKVTIPEAVYRYILFSRAKITPPVVNCEPRDKAYWQSWLEGKLSDQEFGRRVKEKLAYEKQRIVEDTQSENCRLQDEIAKLKDVEEFLKENNLTLGWNYKRTLETRVKNAQDAIPPEFIGALQRLRTSTDELLSLYKQANRNT